MNLQFHLWDAGNAENRQAWADLWAQWPDREVFAHPDYVRLYAKAGQRALCAAATNGESGVLYPLILRNLGAEPYGVGTLRDATDLITPYGYGGPFCWGAPFSGEAAAEFWRQFDAWAVKAQVVSEKASFSLFAESLLCYPGEQRVVSENVVRSLRCSEEEMLHNFEYKVRKNIKNARAKGVTVEVDERGERLDEFLTIYLGTMQRRNAREAYYFSRAYFESILTDLKGQFVFLHARAGGAIISTELVLVSARRVYSFLGGTDAEWFHVRPNDLLKVEIMNWARSAGKSEFVLGGGSSRGDGIYRYKLSFAPEGSMPFSIGCRIHDVGAYEQLVQNRRLLAEGSSEAWQPNPELFPAYRS